MAKPIRIAPIARRTGISDETVRQAYAVFEAFLKNLQHATAASSNLAATDEHSTDKHKGKEPKK